MKFVTLIKYNVSMNSFYYFFSATPQVLAGILALFGVFVVFKIETIKKQLLGLGQYIFDEGDRLVRQGSSTRLHNTESNSIIIGSLKKAIDKTDLAEIKNIIESINYRPFEAVKERYGNVYDYLNTLKNQTIIWSIITAATIILCLLTIPFGKFLNAHCFILKPLFAITSACIIICFIGFILILIKSLKDISFPELLK